MKLQTWLALLVAAVILPKGFAQGTHASRTTRSRPASWAIPVDRPELPNTFQLTTNFYRGAQPSKRGMAALQAMGIKTVINLRAFHADDEELAATGMKQKRLKMEPWHVNDDAVIHFLKIVGDANNLPVFVHCQRGADRTGTMCAVYRIACCGWSKADAILEMKEGGFGFNPAWQNLVNYLERADIEDLKRRAALLVKK